MKGKTDLLRKLDPGVEKVVAGGFSRGDIMTDGCKIQVVEEAHADLETLVDERLQQSEDRMRAITDSARDAILMMDPEGRVSYWNPAAERIFGHTAAEAMGQNLHDLIAPARFHPAHAAAFPAFRKTGQGAAVGKMLDLEARRKDGREISVQLSLSAIRMNDGWHAVGLIRDITLRKQAEEELREKEHLLSESQRLGHIGSFLYDNITGKMSWSEELYRIYGVSPDTFNPTVESFLSLIHPDDRPAMQASMTAFDAGEEHLLDFRINMPDGTIRFIRGWGEAVFDAGNNLIHAAGLVQDITERKHAEEELQRYSAELARNNKELQKALANVRQLTGMLPICASCKKIRDDKGYWSQVESYISQHTEAVFTHGICPECEKKTYEELDKLMNENR